MNEKTELFCQSIAQGMSNTLAAAAAGLKSPPSKTEEVKFRINQLKTKMADNLGIDKEYILKGFQSAVHMAELTESASDMISGYREMGRMLGYYEPQKHEINITTGAIHNLPNDKLIEIAGMEDVIDGEYHLVDAHDKYDDKYDDIER